MTDSRTAIGFPRLILLLDQQICTIINIVYAQRKRVLSVRLSRCTWRSIGGALISSCYQKQWLEVTHCCPSKILRQNGDVQILNHFLVRKNNALNASNRVTVLRIWRLGWTDSRFYRCGQQLSTGKSCTKECSGMAYGRYQFVFAFLGYAWGRGECDFLSP